MTDGGSNVYAVFFLVRRLFGQGSGPAVAGVRTAASAGEATSAQGPSCATFRLQPTRVAFRRQFSCAPLLFAVKSSNILLDRYGRAKLGDVGLAKLTCSGGKDASTSSHSGEKTVPSGFVGTLAWAGEHAIGLQGRLALCQGCCGVCVPRCSLPALQCLLCHAQHLGIENVAPCPHAAPNRRSA